jgi:hypothetical protein
LDAVLPKARPYRSVRWNSSRLMVSNINSATMRLRWLLPLCNLAIDIFLLAVAVHAVDAERANIRHPPPLWHQVYGHVDSALLREGHLPEPVVAIIVGTVPAAIIASLPLPNGWRASSPFDVRWASLYLVLAALFWYELGRRGETATPRFKRVAGIYIWLRVASTSMSMSFWGTMLTMLSHVLLLAVWLGAALYLTWCGASRLFQRVKTPRVPAL